MNKKRHGPQTLLYPMPAVLVGAKVDGRPNYMTAAYCGIASGKPPALTVGIQPVRHTIKGIREHGTFSINVPSVDMAKTVDYCGLYSGKKKDKSKLFNTFYGTLGNAPLIEECPVNLECTVKHSLDLGSHVLFVGEIIETHISEECLVDGKPDPKKVDPLIYTTVSQQYYRLGEFVAKAFQVGKEE